MGVRLDNAKALYLRGIRDGEFEAAIHRYAGDRYTQHSTPVRDGKEGFIEFFANFIERNPQREIEILRGFEDGRFVFLHAVQVLNGGESCWVTADIFDTDDVGKLVEHWDIIEALSNDGPSGRTQVDGPTELLDLGETAANKALVAAFVTEVLQGGDSAAVERFVAEDYVEHNPARGEGRAALAALLDEGAVRYEAVHKLIGSGWFVATLAEVSLDSGPAAVIDLYRVEGAKIVEHWDVTEEILPEDQWVNSGKF